ncbi:hypothetical protein BYT27DRAFT_7181599 [Phlegmacium glaucopus]|nr:hypothetical protein BYT27DRAFT_7181599 [Phlegmacium glaucopus]
MSKEPPGKTVKRSTQVTTRRGANTQPHTRLNTGLLSGVDRTPSPSEVAYTHPDLVNTAKEGRSFLETRLLLAPEGAPATPATLSAALFQISALAKIPREVMQAIRSVAWLLDEVEEDAVAATAREAVNSQLDYLNEEVRSITEHLRTTISTEVGKQVETLTSAVKAMEARINQPTPYKDAVLGQVKAPEGIDPRVTARVGIRSRQFVIDFPAGSPMQGRSQAEVLEKFNEAIAKAEGEGDARMLRLRMVEKLANRGFLGEFLHEDGAKWFTQQNHVNAFITALGDDGLGAQLKKRNHPIIAYYVPLNLNTNSSAHVAEIAEVNNISEGDLLGVRWVKPPARRSPTQTCGHLLLFLASPDAANRAITEGLVICNKRVSVLKHSDAKVQFSSVQWHFLLN